MDTAFNRLAPVYDRMMQLVFGKNIQKAQNHFLAWIPPQANILIIGGGSGWILKEIFAHCPQAQITYIDSAPRMIALAQKNLSPQFKNQVTFICDDEKALPDKHYEIIMTYFFLDLFPKERAQVISQALYARLQANGHWLYADFYANLRGLDWRRYLIRGMYRIARALGHLEAERYWVYESCLKTLALEKKAERYFFFRCIQSAVYQKIA